MWIETHHEGEWSDGAVDQLAHHYGVAAELADDLGGASGVPDDVCEQGGPVDLRGGRPGPARRAAGRRRAPRHPGPRAGRARAVGAAPRAAAVPQPTPGPTPGTSTGPGCDAEQARARRRGAGRAVAGGAGAARAGRRRAEVRARPSWRCGTLAEAADGLRRARRRPRPGRGAPPAGHGRDVPGRVPARPSDAVRAALEAFRQVGSASGEAWALQNLAWIAFTTGPHRRGRAPARHRGRHLPRARRQRRHRPGRSGLLAFVKFQQGDREAAERLGQRDPRRGPRPWRPLGHRDDAGADGRRCTCGPAAPTRRSSRRPRPTRSSPASATPTGAASRSPPTPGR